MRKGVEEAAHKICSALGLAPVKIIWERISTASISARGDLRLADVKDDAVVKHEMFMRYVGFVVHELLHRKYTKFGIRYSNDYVGKLANAIEDARIEHRGIADGLTGNISQVLTTLIEGMTASALDNVEDWDNPAQFPFVLAVYLRNHAKTKVPVHPKVEPIFAEAAVRLKLCKNSLDVAELAEWVYKQLELASDADSDSDDGGEGDEGESADGSGKG